MKRFVYGSGNAHLWGYLPVAVGLAFVYAVLALNGYRPLSGFWFPFLACMALFSIGLELIIRARSPQAFEIDDESVYLESENRTFTVPLNEVSIRKGLDWLITSGRVFRAEGRTFVVFRDLDDFDDFCKAIGIEA